MPGTRLNRAVVLRRRPDGPADAARAECFEVVERPLPELAPGEVRLANIYLSLDPYMASYLLAQHPLGMPIEARVASRVEASRNNALREGELVWGFFGWESHTTLPATLADRKGYPVVANRIDAAHWPKASPLSHAISVLGMPGLTAHVGLVDIGGAAAGETVYVSSAAGALGQIVGQIAKLRGCRAVGSAGSDDKAAFARSLGFDAVFNYKTAPGGIEAALRQHCPDGIDVYFDNVGGATLDAALACMNPHGRVPLCGMISNYGGGEAQAVRKRIALTGFTIYDHFPTKMPAYQAAMRGWLEAGQVRYRETVVDGIERLPQAFAEMLAGRLGVGKCLVRIGDDPLAARAADGR